MLFPVYCLLLQPCLQNVSSGKSFSMCVVIRVFSVSRHWFVYIPKRKRDINKPTTLNTRDTNDYANSKRFTRKKRSASSVVAAELPFRTIRKVSFLYSSSDLIFHQHVQRINQQDYHLVNWRGRHCSFSVNFVITQWRRGKITDFPKYSASRQRTCLAFRLMLQWLMGFAQQSRSLISEWTINLDKE